MTSRPGWADRIRRISIRTLKISVVSVLALVLLGESLSSAPPDVGMAVASPFGVSGAVTSVFAILVLALYRPGRKRWIAVAAIASLAVTLVDLAGSQDRSVGVAETFTLLLLMLYAVRHWDASPGRWVALVLGVAIGLIGFRYYVYVGSTFAGIFMNLVALSSVIGFGAYLRGLDKLRRETQEEVRRAERLELAREMHDFVAHHVTGIVVLAQAAQVTDTDPRRSFADIEEAGLAALASMRRMVRVLRDADAGAGVNPLGDLSQIDELVDRFSREGTDASCFISPDLADKVSPEVAATAHRVVRESLTNIRKHANGASQVRVVVAQAGSQGVEVSVRDDGRGARRRLADTGGGLGLLGLTERVETVGGQLRAGPRPEGGWEVVVWLPFVPNGTETSVV